MYYKALNETLKPVLKTMVQNRYISQDGAKAIYNNANKWAGDFVQRVPHNISKARFQNALAKYIKNLHDRHFNNSGDIFGVSNSSSVFDSFGGSNDSVFGGSNDSVFGGSDDSVFGSTTNGTGFDTGFTTAFESVTTDPPSDDLFGGDEPTKNQEDKESEQAVEFKRNVPEWYKGDTLSNRKFQKENIHLHETTIPASGNAGSSTRFNLVLDRSFKSHNEMIAYVSDVFTQGEFLAQITYNKVINIKGKQETIETFIKDMQAYINEGKAHIHTLRAIINTFDDCSRGIYDGFSEILVGLFNKWVRASALFTSKNACFYNVHIGSLNGISMMLNGPADPRISKVVGDVVDYDSIVSSICAKVLKTLKTIKVTKDPQDIATAMSNTNSGVDGGKYVVFSERGDTSILEEIKEGNVAIKYRDTTGVSNMDYRNSYSITKSILSDGKGVQLSDDVITCNLDAMIIKFHGPEVPTEVYFQDGTIVGYGLSTDMQRIIRVENIGDSD